MSLWRGWPAQVRTIVAHGLISASNYLKTILTSTAMALFYCFITWNFLGLLLFPVGIHGEEQSREPGRQVPPAEGQRVRKVSVE